MGRTASELRLVRVEDPRELAADWDALATASGNIFATREFLDLWRGRLGRQQQLLISVCRDLDTGRAVGILPLYRWRRRPFSIVRFLGHGPGDALGPICAPSDAGRVTSQLSAALADESPRVFMGERLAPESAAAIDGARRIGREGFPAIPLAGVDWDGYLSTRSSNFRQQLRRHGRNLERLHGLRFRPFSHETLVQDFDLLVQLHRARWGDRSSFLADLAFHRDFARVAHDRGWLRLWFAELDGVPVAAWYGFLFAGKMSYYQAGRDPGWRGPPVGLVLLGHTIREGIREGADAYHLLRGAEGYKYRFADLDLDRGVETVVSSRGVAVAAALRTAELARLLRRRARRQPRHPTTARSRG